MRWLVAVVEQGARMHSVSVRARLPTRARATSHDQIKTFSLAAVPNAVAKACGNGRKKSMVAPHSVIWNFRLTCTHGRGGAAFHRVNEMAGSKFRTGEEVSCFHHAV